MLTHIHPAPLRFACGTRPGSRNPILIRLSVRGRPRPCSRQRDWSVAVEPLGSRVEHRANDRGLAQIAQGALE
jgi:hypothetical protein